MSFKTLCETCGSWHTATEPHWKAGDPCSRKCTDCEGIAHHWMEDCDEETGEPVLLCKHCPAQKPWEDLEEQEPQPLKGTEDLEAIAFGRRR